MHRLLSIALLLPISFSLISPLFALDGRSDAGLAACCRRNGAHHCAMSAEQLEALSHGEQFTVVHARCPLYPKAVAPAHHQPYSFEQPDLALADTLSPPERIHQVEAWARAALEGARLKRGPPTVRLS